MGEKSILLVCDDEGCGPSKELLDDSSISHATVRGEGALVEQLRSAAADFSAAVLDFPMTDADGVGIIRRIRQMSRDLPIIVICGRTPQTSTIVGAMNAGATEFLCSPISRENFEAAISIACDAPARKVSPPVRNTPPQSRPGAFIGRSPGMIAIQAILAQVGWADAPVLIQGETGSGKEVIARDLHARSQRAKKPFFKLNCAALPSELVESELFGYERGAFTGAFQRKAGIFEAADGGTILLDEIGDMDVRLQAKLLQVLQDQEFQRIGGNETIKVNVRVLAATHRDLEKQILDGKFREDLYYRLNVINFVVPPLRERKTDLIELAEFLLRKHAQPGAGIPEITPELRAALLAWHWPGNVRELENFVRKLLIFQDAAMLTRELRERMAHRQLAVVAPSLPETLAEGTEGDAEHRGDVSILEEVSNAKRRAEIDAIMAALTATRWNRKHAAALLNIDYKALLYKMKKLGMDQRPAQDTSESMVETWKSQVRVAAC